MQKDAIRCNTMQYVEYAEYAEYAKYAEYAEYLPIVFLVEKPKI